MVERKVQREMEGGCEESGGVVSVCMCVVPADRDVRPFAVYVRELVCVCVDCLPTAMSG